MGLLHAARDRVGARQRPHETVLHQSAAAFGETKFGEKVSSTVLLTLPRIIKDGYGYLYY
jgi:hypothetical protein